jgi:hypothetical protein
MTTDLKIPDKWQTCEQRINKLDINLGGEEKKEEQYKEGEDYDIDKSKVKEYKLPPRPRPFYDWNDNDQRYTGDKDDFKQRLKFKLFKFWLLWVNLRSNTKLEEILAKEVDRESDQYQVNSVLVHVMDILAKILVDTDPLEEMVWLAQTATEQEKKEIDALFKRDQQDAVQI